jgi:hypothetical protein
VSIGDTAITTVSVPDPRSYVVACLKWRDWVSALL